MIFSVSLSLFTVPKASASPIATSSICYIQLASNRLIDLTSICASSYSSPKNTVYSNDDAYLKEVQKLLESNSDQNQTLQLLKSDPRLLTDAARNYCNARLVGMSEQDIYGAKFKEIEQSVQNSSPEGVSKDASQQFEASMSATSVASKLASKIYCPHAAG